VRTGMRDILARSAFATSRPLSLVPSTLVPAADSAAAPASPRRKRRPSPS
jgi:hypothetical protein